MKMKMNYMYLCCCTLAFVLYLNTLNAGFVYDDRRAILRNQDVINISESWSKLFYNDFWGTNLSDSGSHCSYRPLTVLTFKLNHIFGGTNAFGYHLVNVLLHCLATGLVVNLGRHLLPCSISTFLSGLLFATHPIHTEAVAGLTGRADVIACIFFILTILSYIKHVQLREKKSMRHHVAMIAAIISASAAVLCKETAISALVVCAIYDILKSYKKILKDKNQLKSIGTVGIALFIILYFRLSIPGPATPFSTADNPTAKATSIMTRFYTFLYLPVFNFFLLIHPQTLSFDWSMDSIPRIETLFDQRNIFSLIFYSLTLRLIFVCLMNTIHMPESISSSKSSNISGKRITKFTTRKRQHHNDYKISDENKCTVCTVYHGNQKHLNVCNGTILEVVEESNANASIKSMITLSPLRKYIRSSNQNFNAVTMVNNNDDNNNNSLDKDNNNNNIVNLNENSNADNVPNEQVKISFSHISSNKKIITKFKPTKDNEHIEKVYLTDVTFNNEGATKVNRATAALLSVTILILPFLPATNIFFYVGFVIGERILYLPSVGFCLLIGLGIERILNIKGRFQELRSKNRTTHKLKKFIHHHIKTIVISIFITLLLSMSIRTIKRNYDWKSEESLYQSAVCVNPPKALGNLGSVLSSRGKYELAEIALTSALKFRPNMADVHYNLGILYSKQQKHSYAVGSFHKAIYYRPKLTLAYLNLGTSLIALGRFNEAAVILREGSKLDGNGLRDRREHEHARITSLMVLGQLHVENGRLQRAIAIYREALATLPPFLYSQTEKEIYRRLNDIFMRLNQLAKNKLKASQKQTQLARKESEVCKMIFPFGKRYSDKKIAKRKHK